MSESAVGAGEMDDGFDRCADAARHAMNENIRGLLVYAGQNPEAVHAIIMGSLAGAVQMFVETSASTVTRERMSDAVREVVTDFAGQAWDERRAWKAESHLGTGEVRG